MNSTRILQLVAPVLSLSLIPASALLSGCESHPRQRTSEEVRQEALEAWEAARDFGFEKRAEYEQRAKLVAAEYDRQIHEWNRKARTAGTDVRATWNDVLADLRVKQQAFRNSLTRLSTATETTWSEIRSAINQASNEVSNGLERAAERLR